MCEKSARTIDVSDRGTLTALPLVGMVFWPVMLAVVLGALFWECIKSRGEK